MEEASKYVDTSKLLQRLKKSEEENQQLKKEIETSKEAPVSAAAIPGISELGLPTASQSAVVIPGIPASVPIVKQPEPETPTLMSVLNTPFVAETKILPPPIMPAGFPLAPFPSLS
jgi:hypothetical protein